MKLDRSLIAALIVGFAVITGCDEILNGTFTNFPERLSINEKTSQRYIAWNQVGEHHTGAMLAMKEWIEYTPTICSMTKEQLTDGCRNAITEYFRNCGLTPPTEEQWNTLYTPESVKKLYPYLSHTEYGHISDLVNLLTGPEMDRDYLMHELQYRKIISTSNGEDIYNAVLDVAISTVKLECEWPICSPFLWNGWNVLAADLIGAAGGALFGPEGALIGSVCNSAANVIDHLMG